MIDRMLGRSKNDDNSEPDIERDEEKVLQDDGLVEEEEAWVETGHDEEVEEVNERGSRLFDRSNQVLHDDKTSMDLMLAVENAVLAKRMSDDNIGELHNRLEDAREQIAITSKDLERTQALLAEKEDQMEDLKQKLADKNVQIDHAMEQYRRIESEMSDTVDELKNKIDVEEHKYHQLYEQNHKEAERARREIEERDRRIHELEGENANLRQQLEEVKQQNSYLMNVVRDFTDQVSGSLDRIVSDPDEVGSEEHSDSE